jgi:hypothetical protein
MKKHAVRALGGLALLPLTIMLMAASPQRRGEPLAFTTSSFPLPGDDSALAPSAKANRSGYEPAPVPDRDLVAPSPAPQTGADISPSLFMPKTQFRGDGYMAGSTSQSVQEKNVRPAAGFNVRMPLQ